jgi:hypothetical protein
MPQGRAQSRRDVPIVAWHEVLETAPPQNNRPVGHGMIGRRPSCCPLTPMGADCGGAATDDLVPEVFRVERCACFLRLITPIIESAAPRGRHRQPSGA